MPITKTGPMTIILLLLSLPVFIISPVYGGILIILVLINLIIRSGKESHERERKEAMEQSQSRFLLYPDTNDLVDKEPYN